MEFISIQYDRMDHRDTDKTEYVSGGYADSSCSIGIVLIKGRTLGKNAREFAYQLNDFIISLNKKIEGRDSTFIHEDDDTELINKALENAAKRSQN